MSQCQLLVWKPHAPSYMWPLECQWKQKVNVTKSTRKTFQNKTGGRYSTWREITTQKYKTRIQTIWPQKPVTVDCCSDGSLMQRFSFKIHYWWYWLQMPVSFVCKAGKKQLIIIIFDCICYFQSHPYQQEWLAHTAQLPVSHRTDVWSFCWRHQSDQRHICLSDCKCAIASFSHWGHFIQFVCSGQ